MTTPLKKVPIHLQSASNRLLIKNGTVVNGDFSEQADVYIEEGMIKQIGTRLIIPGGTRIINALGKLIMPGGIDMDVRFQNPFKDITSSIDDFYYGTKASISDGTTLVLQNIIPLTNESLEESLEKWKKIGDSKSCCHYSLRLKITPDTADPENIQKLVREKGINSFSISTGGNDKINDDLTIMNLLEASTQSGAMMFVECGAGDIVERNEQKILSKGITGPEGFAIAHSEIAEEETVIRMTTLASTVDSPLYVSSVMSPKAAQVIFSKKEKGSVIFGETPAASIGADGNAYRNKSWAFAAAHVCSPPIRPGSGPELEEALISGALDVVSSKHSTFTSKQKSMGISDFTQIPQGFNGAESRMSVLWEKCVRSGSMTPNRFVSVVSTIPAKICNLFPDKGHIAVGSDADIVIWDPEATRIISATSHPIKSDVNIFEGMEVKGKADTVIVGGRVMFDEGDFKVIQGYGKFVPCPPFSPIVFDNLGKKSEPRGVERSVEDMIIPEFENGFDIPGPATPEVEKVPQNQHESNLDFDGHSNSEDPTVGQANPNARQATVRVRAPPGGASKGFW